MQRILTQLCFLRMSHLFNSIFSAHRLFFRFKNFIMHQCYRTPAFCIAGSLSGIMSTDAFIEIVCPSGIQTAVLTFYNIRIIHNSSSPGLCTVLQTNVCKTVYTKAIDKGYITHVVNTIFCKKSDCEFYTALSSILYYTIFPSFCEKIILLLLEDT